MPRSISQTISTISSITLTTCVGVSLLFLTACKKNEVVENAPLVKPKEPVLVTSDDISEGQVIAKEFTADGANISPSIEWQFPPEKAASFAVIVDDPDAPGGDWIHWVVYDIPANEKGLPRGFSREALLPNKTQQGRTSFRKIGYGGPQPPPGKIHHYYFTVYALDTRGLPSGLNSDGLLRSIQGHIVGSGKLMGTYKR